MSSLLWMCSNVIHRPATIAVSGKHCPECQGLMMRMTRREIMDAYTSCNQQDRWKLALIYHDFPEKDPKIDWVTYAYEHGGRAP